MTVKTISDPNVQQCVKPSTLFTPRVKLPPGRASLGASAMFVTSSTYVGFRASFCDRLTMDSRTDFQRGFYEAIIPTSKQGSSWASSYCPR